MPRRRSPRVPCPAVWQRAGTGGAPSAWTGTVACEDDPAGPPCYLYNYWWGSQEPFKSHRRNDQNNDGRSVTFYATYGKAYAFQDPSQPRASLETPGGRCNRWYCLMRILVPAGGSVLQASGASRALGWTGEHWCHPGALDGTRPETCAYGPEVTLNG